MSLKPILQSSARPDISSLIPVSLVSDTQAGVQGNGSSSRAQFSADGHYVIFASWADNLVTGDSPGTIDIFRKNPVTGEVVRVSTDQDHAENRAPQISADGQIVVFEGDNDRNFTTDILLKDLTTGQTRIVSSNAAGTPGDFYSTGAQISADGKYLVFESLASNLVPDDNNFSVDLFRKDLESGAIIKLTPDHIGNIDMTEGFDAKLSADGRYVVFQSRANNLVEGDTNNALDIFRITIATGEIVRVSVAANGGQAHGDSRAPQISADGRYVVFGSTANNLVPGDTDADPGIFRKDLVTGEIIKVADAPRHDGMSDGGKAQISADGRYVVFESLADNLVPGDNNIGTMDVFWQDLATGETVRISNTLDGAPHNSRAGNARISADGRHVLFDSVGKTFVPGDNNLSDDVFLVDVQAMAHVAPVREGRAIELTFATEHASSISLAWGDGTIDTVTPAGGSASFRHVYASTGVKAAVVTSHSSGQSWAVPYVIDLATGQTTRSALPDTLTGSIGVDSLMGDAEANNLVGLAANDQIQGGLGNDILRGGLGNDVLSGQTGRDAFVFDTKFNKRSNLDTIRDYKAKDDALWLEADLFKGNRTLYKAIKQGSETKPVQLKKAFFATGSAKDSNDFFVMDTKKRVLSYDADGSGAKAAVAVVKFASKEAMKSYIHSELFFI